MKFEALLRESANERRAFEKRTEQLIHKMSLDFKEFENRLDRIANQTIYKTVTILGTLIVVVGALSTFSHYLIH